MLIDTHCHLNHADFDADREAVVARAREAGVGAMVVIGYDLPSSEAAVALAAREPALYATVGIHPNDATTLDDGALGRLAALAASPRVVAVGEIGLDFHWDLAPRPVQETAFRRQIRLARELGLPIVVHSRKSDPDVLDLLEAEAGEDLRGIFHCFEGDPVIAARCRGIGFTLGLGGRVTFKNARTLHETVRELPLEQLVLETDAPYLAPHPHRGRRNEPAHVALVAARLAELRGCPLREVETVTTASARALFGTRLSVGTVPDAGVSG